MKKVLLVLMLSAFLAPVFAQNDTINQKSSDPVTNTFMAAILIDNQTVSTPGKGKLELEIQHRFGLISTVKDLYGIYASANTRIGFNYGITDRLMVGLGTTKNYQLQDVEWKYLILRQTEDDKMPVSLSYYGNVVLDARPDNAFGPTESYRFIHRFYYFTQFIVARKINERFSVQVAPSIAYFNSVPQYSADSTYKNLNFGLSVGGKAKLFGNHSIVVEYDQLLTKQPKIESTKPNLSIGWEIDTPTHTFRVFVANYDQIINQRNLVYNTNDFAKWQYLFGFNITVRF
ncbi:MAG: DUF5777 family beta-barrel protein [Bacteroidales bacterium]|jgi:hypothetical protein